MEHTWEANHLPKLKVSNLDTGAIAVCCAGANRCSDLPEFDLERVAFVGPLHSQSDLEWLLRGLVRHPGIQHVVLCGDDANAVGESLLRLWTEAPGSDGENLASGRPFPAELDPVALATLRASVQVTDLRGKNLSDVSTTLGCLSDKATEQTQVERSSLSALPNPTVPARNVFLSRKTSFPIFSSSVADSWLQLLNLTLRIGTDKASSKGERFSEALNTMVTIETPVLEDGEEGVHDDFPEFLDFNRDEFESRYFPHYASSLDDRSGTDAVGVLCERLRTSHDTRSGTLVFQELHDRADATLAPGLISATLNIVDEKLFGSFVLRSCDVYTDWPLEASALVRIQRDAAERLGVEVATSTFIIHSAHLYDGDWTRSLQRLEDHFKRPLPLHVDPSGVFLFGNDGGAARAMLLNHDASKIQWEEAFSDPEDLSWYIVDVMPWLLPQHIRYVGQECASLMRAMQEKECYLQG